jgi:hypothetical protein
MALPVPEMIYGRASIPYLSDAYTRSHRPRTVAAMPKAGPFITPKGKPVVAYIGTGSSKTDWQWSIAIRN